MALAALLCCVTSARARRPQPTPSEPIVEQRLAAQEARSREQEARLRDQEARLRQQEARLRQQESRLRTSEQAQTDATVRPPPREPLFGFGSEGFYLGGKRLLPGPPARHHPGRRARLLQHRHHRHPQINSSSAAPAPSSKAPSPTSLDFRIVPDFGQGQALLFDAYVDIRPWRFVALRVGKFKSPFGLERLQNDAFLTFAERGLPSDLVPDRDIGASLHGDVANGAFLWELGLFDGALDNNSANQDGDTNDGKDVVVRVFGHPLRPLRRAWLHNLGVGAAASYGKQHGTASLPGVGPYKTTGQNTFFAYYFDSTALKPTVIAISNHYRFSPQLYWYLGPFGLLAEYVYDAVTVTNSLAGAPPRTTLVHQAWQVEVSGVVDRRARRLQRHLPQAPLQPAQAALRRRRAGGALRPADHRPVELSDVRRSHEVGGLGAGVGRRRQLVPPRQLQGPRRLRAHHVPRRRRHARRLHRRSPSRERALRAHAGLLLALASFRDGGGSQRLLSGEVGGGEVRGRSARLAPNDD